MSLKWFHVLFITLSIVTAIGAGVWALNAYLTTHDGGDLAIAVVLFAVAVALVVYERGFLRKVKRMGLD